MGILLGVVWAWNAGCVCNTISVFFPLTHVSQPSGTNLIKHTANKKLQAFNFQFNETTFEIIYIAPRTNKPFNGAT